MRSDTVSYRVNRALLFAVLLAAAWLLSPAGPAWAQCGDDDGRTVLCVDQDNSWSGCAAIDGTSVYTNVQDALDWTNGNGGIDYEIWVAAGIYYPDVDSDGDHLEDERDESFEILYNNVQLYGGFVGSEGGCGGRDWEANPTILSGDIDQNDVTAAGVVTDAQGIQGSNAAQVVLLDGAAREAITATTVIDGFTITGGYDASCGGGLLCDGGDRGSDCSPILRHIIFSGNLAEDGGGMCCDGTNGGNSSPRLTNVVFSGNEAGAGSGGGMRNDGDEGNSSPVLTDVAFRDNRASASGSHGGLGGGMYNCGVSGGNASPTLTNVSFIGNVAERDGGGMYDDGYATGGTSSPVLTNVSFVGNVARHGGGMHNDGSNRGESSPMLTNVLFSGNQASRRGGGMYNDGSHDGESSPTLTNVTFGGNRASYGGGGMFNEASDMASGTCDMELTNVVMWGNAAGSYGEQLYHDYGTLVLSYSLVQSGTNQIQGDVTYGDGILTVDPQFVNPITATAAPTTAGDYRLTAASPAVDAGYNDVVAQLSDLDGNPRKVDGDGDDSVVVDMGAYELQKRITVGGAVMPAVSVARILPLAAVVLVLGVGGGVVVRVVRWSAGR
jgi:hypothetical protein